MKLGLQENLTPYYIYKSYRNFRYKSYRIVNRP